MTNPRGKLFATASFCAHAAPVIAGAYRPLHARWRKGGENEERGEKKNWRRRERGRGKIIIFEVDDEATGEETNLFLGSPEFLVAGAGDPLRDEWFESLAR